MFAQPKTPPRTRGVFLIVNAIAFPVLRFVPAQWSEGTEQFTGETCFGVGLTCNIN